MKATAVASGAATSTVLGVSPNFIVAALVLVGALVLATLMASIEAELTALWLLGIAAGFVLQRSRFCFTAAFRDLFLFGSARTMKGVLFGLAVASTGFAIVMHAEVPFPGLGALPREANILPVGISTVLGGLLFGLGMVLSGGCVSGSLYRVAEGYVGSWVSLAGIVIGLGLVSQTWNWWWTTLISHEPRIWLPATGGLGYSGALALTIAGLLGAFLLVLWWESRAGIPVSTAARVAQVQATFGEKLRAIWRAVFEDGWSPVAGGGVLGVLGLLMYMVHMPWGVTGELTRWANASMSALSVPAPVALGLKDIGGCAARAAESGLFSHTFSVTVGLLVGAFVAALLAREFKLRFPTGPTRYAQSLGGGLCMGAGSGLAIGCTIGAFFSAIPSLSASGWLFGLALAGGASLGVEAIKRIP